MRDRIDKLFYAWGKFVVRHRWPALIFSLLMTGFFVSFLPQLQVDNSTESFLRPDDPAVVLYNQFRDDFDRDDRIIAAIETTDVYTFEFLTRLRAFHQHVERQVPYLHEVVSLINARDTRGEDDTLVVGELMEDWPRSAPDLVQLRKRVRENPLLSGVLISESETMTILSIKPLTYSSLGDDDALAGFDDEFEADSEEPAFVTAQENAELLDQLMQVVAAHDTPGFTIHVAGALPMTENINAQMQGDVALYIGLGFVAIFVLLLILFRRVTGVVAPLLVVGLSLLSALGIMVMIGIPGSVSVQMLPILLLAVGVCDSVHILTIVYQQLQAGQGKEEAIAFALSHSGVAVLMTSLTTAAGMGSFAAASLAPVAHLGIVTPIGVMLALFYTVVLLPALLAIAPMERTDASKGESTGKRLDRVLARVGEVSTGHPWKVVLGTFLLAAFFAVGLTGLRFEHNGLEWFPPGDPVREAFNAVQRELDSTITLEVVIDSGEENGLHDPGNLERIESAMRRAEQFEIGDLHVGKATSLVDVLKETHQALNENRPEFYEVPEERQLIAQELLLFENSGSDDLEEIVDSQFQVARMTLRVPWADAMLYPPFMEQLAEDTRSILGTGLPFHMTGLMPLMAEIFVNLLTSMARSYVIALLVITPLMMLLLGSLRMGMLSMIPNLLPVLAALGVMGWLDIALDASTILIGAIIIGIAVDDTIHFMHRFQRYYEQSGDAHYAVSQTLSTTGAALLFTTLVLTAGFLIISLSYLENMSNFGLITAMATAVAFFADVFVAPALMVLAVRWKESRAVAEPA